ncbi:DUF4123 domain-containing protein [Pectobacterium sp. B1J-3]|uniref:DUF4123 domain-containing protein n=1 Tax=Pectobacterium sp. B1J-3 TaxID=3385371 RepID=UPI003905A0C3
MQNSPVSVENDAKIEALFARLSRYFAERQYCVLLFDAFAASNAEETRISDLYDVLEKREHYELQFDHPNLNRREQPWLVPLNLEKQDDIALFRHSVELAYEESEPQHLDKNYGRCICAWLDTEKTLPYIAAQLGGHAVQAVAEDAFIFLRFYDPSVLPALLMLCDRWQCQRLLSAVKTWALLDGDCGLWVKVNQAEPTTQLSFSLSLSTQQAKDIELIAPMNQALRVYRQKTCTDERFSETEARGKMLPALRRAITLHHLTDEADLCLFAQHALDIHPDFDFHPRINRLLKPHVSASTPPYRFAIADITSDEWLKIKSDCQ